MYRIRRFFRRIHNLYRWFPIIWKDQDWDHYFIWEILKTKLKFQSEYISNGYHESSEQDAENMKRVIELIDIVQNEKFIDEVLHDKKWDVARFDEAEVKHNNARKELFNILEQNIEKWWD